MINQYDQLEENVKLHEAIRRGKTKSTTNLGSLGMKTILQKNREMKQAKKDHISKVIQARKLKIKISDILNIKNSFNNNYAAKPEKQVSSQMFNKGNSKSTNMLNPNNHSKFQKSYPVKKSPSVDSSKMSRARGLSLKQMKGKHLKEDDGRINLFENFTQNQLNEIEQDEKYYLVNDQVINIFRKYMIKKRQNNKDYSYEKFGIKPPRKNFEEDSSFDKKEYILNTLGIKETKDTPKTDRGQAHLLTNPLQFRSTMKDKKRSKSVMDVRNRRSMIGLFKDKQIANQQKLRKEYEKKTLELKIDRNYFDGLAAEKRAMFQDKMLAEVVKKNRDHDQKSFVYIQRIKTAREDVGKSIELAETIRTEILKRRTARMGKKN